MAEATLHRYTVDKSGAYTLYWDDGSVNLYASKEEMIQGEGLSEHKVSRQLALMKVLQDKPALETDIDEKQVAVVNQKVTVDFSKADEAVTIEAATVKAEAEGIRK